jgi:prepilin-type processing-associated H-X9-DG protein
MKQFRLKNAFSLVELLVVIAVIMFLAGLMIIAIRGVKERSVMTVCKNNLKQLHTAAMIACVNVNFELPHARSGESYGSDERWHQSSVGWVDWCNYTDGHGFRAPTVPNPGSTPWYGPSGVLSVVKGSLWDATGRNPKLYVCPAFNLRSTWTAAGNNNPKGPNNVTLSLERPEKWFAGDSLAKITNLPRVIARTYVMNSAVSGMKIGDMEGSKRLLFADMAISTNNLPYSTNTIAAWCVTSGLAGAYLASTSWDDPSHQDGELRGYYLTGRTIAVESVGNIHPAAKGFGGANAVFVDGHVETILWNQTTNACQGSW